MASLAIQNDVAAALSQSLEIEVSLKSALDIVFERLSLQEGMIFLWDGERQYLSLSSYRGDKSPQEIQSLAEEGSLYWQISNQARSGGRCLTRAPSDEMPSTLVSTPLLSKGREVGAMTLVFSDPWAAEPHDLDLLTAVGQQMGMAVENARLYQEAEGWADDMMRLQEASAALTTSFNEAHITRMIAEQSAGLMDCQAAGVVRFDPQTRLLEWVAQHGLSEADARLVAGDLNHCDLLTGLSDSPQLISVQNCELDPRVPASWREQFHLRSLLCLPVWGADHPLMYLCLFDVVRHRQWKPQELELIESFASRAAVAVMNARLHKQLETAAALEERQRIAADFHDGLAQTLSLLGLRVDQVSDQLDERIEPTMLAALQTVREVVNQASVDVRRSIASLREPPEPRASLQSQLTQLVVRQSDHGQAPIELVDHLPQPLFISKDHLQQVLPLLQEAILNARNHAQAKTIRIVLERQGEEVQITVEDDGVGFNPEDVETLGDHFGLSIMHARAGRMGARLQIQSARGHGTRISLAWCPASEVGVQRVETNIQNPETSMRGL